MNQYARPRLTAPQQDTMQAFLRSNPGLSPQGGASSIEGGTVTPCSADRVLLAGGQLASYITPTAIVPLEFLWRTLPPEGVFTATPQAPVQFDLGSFRVPQSQGFVLLDYRFDIYRPSGAAAGDFVPLEENRLPTQVGWNIRSNANIQGNYHYELNPAPAAESSAAYRSNANPGFIPGGPAQPATDDQFAIARAQQAQAASGDLSLMPQRHHRQGLLHVPAPWLLHSNESITTSCHIFRGVQIPLAFFEASIFGFLLPDNDLLEIQKALAPCASRTGGV